MTFALFSLGYLAVHLGIFAIWLRRLPAFRSERTIFFYHFVSFFCLALAVPLAGVWLPASELWIAATFTLALHGLYSLSFLELWSLTQGSYSLSILDTLTRAQDTATRPAFGQFAETGEGKREARAHSLIRLGLVHRTPQGLELSLAGRVAAAVLAAIIRITNGRSLNL